MTNGANYKRGKLHHSLWHSDIRTSNQLNIWATREGFDKKGRRRVEHPRPHTVRLLAYVVHWTAFSHGVNCDQLKLSIDIHYYSNVWKSIHTAWRVIMPSWREHHSIALVPGTILWTIVCVYVQPPGGIPTLAEMKALHMEQWHILYPMTSVVCAFSTARGVGCCVEWLHSWDDLSMTQFGPRWMRSERYMWYAMH